MNPRILFERANPLYESQLVKMPEYIVPDAAVCEEKIAALKQIWNEWSEKVFAQLAAITKMEWQEADIRCYVVSGTRVSFSHPLTLKLYDTDEQMFDTFVHELIHRLLKTDNPPDRIKEARKKFLEPYAGESATVKHHIILHAVHAELLSNLFGQERVERVIATSKNPDYVRAWEIVRQRGRKTILKDVFDYRKKV